MALGPPSEIDAYALHFVARANDSIVANLRIACQQDGPVESAVNFPMWVLTKCGDGVAKVRACQHPDLTRGSQIMTLLENIREPLASSLQLRINIVKARVEQRRREQKPWIAALEWSQDGMRLASAGRDATIKVWNATTGAELSTLSGHSAAVTQLAWSNDRRRLASSSLDGSVRVWDPDLGVEVMLVCQQEDAAHLTWNSDGTRLATMANDGYQRIWDARIGSPRAEQFNPTTKTY